MACIYRPTDLEKSVSKLLLSIGILEPQQIQEKLIAEKLGIYLTFTENRCYSVDYEDIKIININNNLNFIKKREVFFHELAHVLRHCGNQFIMPKSFRELQEWDAQNFVLYAVIPYHMLHFIDYNDSNILEQMVSMFKVSQQICLERIEQIKNRSYDKLLRIT